MVSCKVQNLGGDATTQPCVVSVLTFNAKFDYRLESIEFERSLPGGKLMTGASRLYFDAAPDFPSHEVGEHEAIGKIRKTEKRFSKVSRTPLPKAEFSMEHYGLSEMSGAIPNRLMTYIGVLLLGGLGVFVITFALRWWKVARNFRA
jgi:hypothetical protein